MRTLIVDDVGRMAHILADTFSVREYVMDLAPSGREALDRLQRDHLDCVLTDIEMPEMDGIQLCCAIMTAHRRTLVVCIAARCSDRLVQEDCQQGMAATRRPCC